MLGALSGCAVPTAAPVPSVPWPPDPDEPVTFVWVVRHGLHSRIALRRADVDPAVWPESRALGEVEYLEVGWGDRDFYPTPDPSRGLLALARFFRDAYARDPAGRPVPIRPGYYPRSWFYEATGRYHALTHNSNHWAARALRAAGVPVDPTTATTAGALLSQACRFGTSVGAGSCQRDPAALTRRPAS